MRSLASVVPEVLQLGLAFAGAGTLVGMAGALILVTRFPNLHHWRLHRPVQRPCCGSRIALRALAATMIRAVKRDLVRLAQGIGIASPALFIVAVFTDLDPQTWSGLLTTIALIVLAAIPVFRDEIQQAKQRERDGLRH